MGPAQQIKKDKQEPGAGSYHFWLDSDKALDTRPRNRGGSIHLQEGPCCKTHKREEFKCHGLRLPLCGVQGMRHPADPTRHCRCRKHTEKGAFPDLPRFDREPPPQASAV